MKVQELEGYKEQYRKSQDEVKALKAKVHCNSLSHCSHVVMLILTGDSG